MAEGEEPYRVAQAGWPRIPKRVDERTMTHLYATTIRNAFMIECANSRDNAYYGEHEKQLLQHGPMPDHLKVLDETGTYYRCFVWLHAAHASPPPPPPISCMHNELGIQIMPSPTALPRWVHPQSVNRVAETATCSGLARNVLRTVMRACSASRKEAMRRLRANGLNSSARKVDMNTAGFRAASQTEEGEDGIGVAEERSGSGAAVAEGALARRTVCAVAATGGNILASTQPCELPHIEQFVSRLEEGLRTIDGVGQDARENLVNVARGPAARKGFAEMFA